MKNKYKLNFESAMNKAYDYADKIEDTVNKLRQESENDEEFYEVLCKITNDKQAYENMKESAERAIENGYYNAYLTQSLINYVYEIFTTIIVPNKMDIDEIREYLDDLTEEEVITLATDIINIKEMN